MSRHSRHFTARLGAVTAGIGTFLHMLVSIQGFTIRRACFTDFGANAAENRVKIRIPDHEIGGGAAYLGAIH